MPRGLSAAAQAVRLADPAAHAGVRLVARRLEQALAQTHSGHEVLAVPFLAQEKRGILAGSGAVPTA